MTKRKWKMCTMVRGLDPESSDILKGGLGMPSPFRGIIFCISIVRLCFSFLHAYQFHDRKSWERIHILYRPQTAINLISRIFETEKCTCLPCTSKSHSFPIDWTSKHCHPQSCSCLKWHICSWISFHNLLYLVIKIIPCRRYLVIE